MAEYVHAPIETDPDALADDATAWLEERVPGWEASAGALEVVLVEAVARMAAEVRDVASDVPPAIFRWFGANLAGLPPIEAAPAIASTTWTAPDAAGYTVEDGFSVGLRTAGDELLRFVVDGGPYEIPPGTTEVVGVAVVAEQEGSAWSGLGAPGAPLEVIDAGPASFDVALVAPTAGGVDDESDDAYLARLREELRLQSPRPILPADFEVLAKRVPGVERALALDLYKPADQPNPGDPAEAGRERSVTVAVADAAGEAVPALEPQVRDLLQSMRETSFEVWVIGPTYTPVDVTWAAVAWPGWDPADVEARGDAAVAEYLDPALWGAPPRGETRPWVFDDRVRLGELYEVLNRVDGLHHVTALTFARSGDPLAAADVVLAGPAPLPRAGAIAGDVAAG